MKFTTSNSKNLLHIAADQDLPLTLCLLLDAANKQNVLDELTHAVDNFGYQPVHYSAVKLSVKCFEKFLEYGTDITGITSNNDTVVTIMGMQVDKESLYN